MKHSTGKFLFRRQKRQPARTRRRPDWERPFAEEDPLWREWNQTKQRKEIY